MIIWERICVVCEKKFGCSFYNRSGDVINWECNTCVFYNTGKECLAKIAEIKRINDICTICGEDNELVGTDNSEETAQDTVGEWTNPCPT